MSKKIKIIFLGLTFLAAPFIARATIIDFNVDPSYDYSDRTKITAFLYQFGTNAYFYVEDGFYQSLNDEEKKRFAENMKNLSQEFDNAIYPQLTKFLGSEWTPGIDGDRRIIVLLSRIKMDSGGYFNPGDEYPKIQIPTSNEKEMIYLNANYIESPLAKSYLAHELVHLITFNQKNKTYGISEEIWLNEGRAEYVPTLLGYDNNFEGSNLQNRVRTFVQGPNDSLTEWKNESPDYGVLNIFIQYLVDHYGTKILTDSLHFGGTGIPSLNAALIKNGYSEDFSQIFSNWTIAVSLNDCNMGMKYCFLNPNLKNLKILPQLNYLPLAGESTLTVVNYTKDWTGNWVKFIGGQGMLKIEFIGEQKVNFEVPYLIQDSAGNYSINFLKLDNSQGGTVYISNFGKKYNSLIMIPSLQNKLLGFDGIEPFYKFIWSASIVNENSGEEELINNLLAQIEFLKAEILKVQAQINAILTGKGQSVSCQRFENNLYYGLKNSSEVRCLQEFLKNQGTGIYPEGSITGNFLTATRTAVIRFQEKYKEEILIPLGLGEGTGFVGPTTRAKINQLSGK